MDVSCEGVKDEEGLSGRGARAGCTDTGIVDEQRDARIGFQDCLNLRQGGGVGQVGGNGLNRTSAIFC